MPEAISLSPPVIINDRDHRLGMAGAVRAGFDAALSTGHEYALWVEEDFLFHELPLGKMRQVLDGNPHLAQVVLKRQPWSAQEIAAGGIIEANSDDYTDRSSPGEHLAWVEHRRIFSLNPCLIPQAVLKLGWPDGNEAEFTQRCLDQGLSFAFYGRSEDPPRVTHVGEVRGAGWRL